MTNSGLRWGYIHICFPAGLKASEREKIEGKELRKPRKKKPLLPTNWKYLFFLSPVLRLYATGWVMTDLTEKYLVRDRVSRPWVFFICSIGCWSAIIQGGAVIWKLEFHYDNAETWEQTQYFWNHGFIVSRGTKPARRVSRVRPRPTTKSRWILSQDSLRDFF